MKSKKLVKQALKQPNLFSEGELSYFKLWLILKKKGKTAKINKRQEGTS
tara:strand:+ start:1002 stop:1148 length:147 start_codon:yes stop_codon:yes gene_type:complete